MFFIVLNTPVYSAVELESISFQRMLYSMNSNHLFSILLCRYCNTWQADENANENGYCCYCGERYLYCFLKAEWANRRQAYSEASQTSRIVFLQLKVYYYFRKKKKNSILDVAWVLNAPLRDVLLKTFILTHSFPAYPFFNPWKHQKTVSG